MVVKFLARAAVTGLLLSIAAPMTGAAQEAAVTDSSFLQTAGSIGLLQAKLAKMAQSKASSPAVREFGKKMETDYAQVNEAIAAGAKQAAYPSPVIIRQKAPMLSVNDARLLPTTRSRRARMAATHSSLPRPMVKVIPCPATPSGLSVFRIT